MDTETLAKKIRRHAVRMTSLGGSSHIASVLSMTDILAVLYGHVLRLDPKNPKWEDRDRFILSKGHSGAGVYAALAERGFFPVSQLDTHCQNGSRLSGHVSHKDVPGVELSTGSLGHGLSVAAGMALAGKLAGKTHRVFTVLSDGECDEGSNWEAILFAPHHKLDNLVAVIDYNKIQSLTSISDTLELEPFVDKWRSFGWSVLELDGHDHKKMVEVFSKLPFAKDKPSCVIAHTTKGKGVSFMENSVLWHYRTAKGAEFDDAMKELDKA
ncbi:MAG TPA: transketolase [bacterium]|nr:transketolase [bacterium]